MIRRHDPELGDNEVIGGALSSARDKGKFQVIWKILMPLESRKFSSQ
jgi:hypothetical protein